MSRLTKMKTLLGSLLGDKRSHPEKLLIDHLRRVTEFAQAMAQNHSIVIDEDLLAAVTLTHDLGKVHGNFKNSLMVLVPV